MVVGNLNEECLLGFIQKKSPQLVPSHQTEVEASTLADEVFRKPYATLSGISQYLHRLKGKLRHPG